MEWSFSVAILGYKPARGTLREVCVHVMGTPLVLKGTVFSLIVVLLLELQVQNTAESTQVWR